MSRALVLAVAAALAIAACSSSSSKGFAGDAGSSGSSGAGDGGHTDAGSTSGAPTDGAVPLARGAVDASLSGANCMDRLALKFGTISPSALVSNGDPNGGDAVNIGCTVTAATGAYSVSFALASGVSFGVRGTSDKPSAILGNDSSQYNADACTVQTSDVALDHVVGSIKCTSTTTGGSSSGNPTPSPCELDADFAVYGCVAH